MCAGVTMRYIMDNGLCKCVYRNTYKNLTTVVNNVLVQVLLRMQLSDDFYYHCP